MKHNITLITALLLAPLAALHAAEKSAFQLLPLTTRADAYFTPGFLAL
jgi:hypothetical protein